MKKNLLQLLLLLFPVFVFAQKDLPVLEKFTQPVKTFPKTLKYDDFLNIMQLNHNNDTFELIAVNDRMQVFWRLTLQGYGLTLARINDKVIAISNTDYKTLQGAGNVYKATSIDVKTGKVIADKVIYTGVKEYMEMPYFTHEAGGNFFTMAVRETAVKRKVHVGLPGPFALFTLMKMSKDADATRSITVFEINDKLEAVNMIKPAVLNGKLFDISSNENQTFLSWVVSDNTVTVQRFEKGNATATGKLNITPDLRDKIETPENTIGILPSNTNPNMVYFASLNENSDKEQQLTMGWLDFSNNTQKRVPIVLTKDYLKALTKNYKPINKDFDDKPDMGYIKGMNIKYFNQHNEDVIIGLSSERSLGGGMSGIRNYVNGGSILIDVFSKDLKLKSENILPSEYNAGYTPGDGFFATGNILHVATNNGSNSLHGIYAQLDLNTGKWLRMEKLSKKNIDSKDWITGRQVLWYSRVAVLPYLGYDGMFSTKNSVTLQYIRY